jgi:hypothetical protein
MIADSRVLSTPPEKECLFCRFRARRAIAGVDLLM